MTEYALEFNELEKIIDSALGAVQEKNFRSSPLHSSQLTIVEMKLKEAAFWLEEAKINTPWSSMSELIDLSLNCPTCKSSGTIKITATSVHCSSCGTNFK